MAKKKPLFILCLLLSASCSLYAQVVQDTLRILAIGNSFSQDAVEQYLHELATAADKKIVIGNLYIGGAPLSLHWENVQGNKANYSYRKIDTDGGKSTRDSVSILSALKDESWDYVSLQQASPLSGKFDTYTEPLKGLRHFLDSVYPEQVKFIWHQTWAYAPTSTHKGFADYDNNQRKMYKSIMKASKKAKKRFGFDLLVPSGTAIQNARTTFLGGDLTRDGFHLDLHIGRFIAACTWFESLFGQEAPTDRYRPERVTEEAAKVAKQAAHEAVQHPYSVTAIAVP